MTTKIQFFEPLVGRCVHCWLLVLFMACSPSPVSFHDWQVSHFHPYDKHIIALLLFSKEAIVPDGDDYLEAGDHVIIFSLPEAIREVEEFFS